MQYMEAGVHGNMDAAPKHVAVDKKLEEELVQTRIQNMEGIPVKEILLIFRPVIFKIAQVIYLPITIIYMSESHVNSKMTI